MKLRQILPRAAYCSSLSAIFLGKPPRRGRRLRSSLSAFINKRIRDRVIGKKTEAQQKTAAETLVKSTIAFQLL